MKPLVYIASPYTRGNVCKNIRSSIDAFVALLNTGDIVPISPISMTHTIDIVHPHSWLRWMEYDMDLIARCDAVWRINSVWGEYVQEESRGADMEVTEAERLGIPVFYEFSEIEEWAIGFRN